MKLWDFFFPSRSSNDIAVDLTTGADPLASVKHEATIPNLVALAKSGSSTVTTTTHNVLVGNLHGNSIDNNVYNVRAILSESIESKAEYINLMNSIRDNEYVELILRNLSNDVMNKNYDKSSDFIQFVMVNPKYKSFEKAIKKDIKDLRIHELLSEIIEDYLFYGQYILKYDYDKDADGTKSSKSSRYDSLSDELDQDLFIPATHKGKLSKVFSESTGELIDSSEFLVLTYNHNYERIKVKGESGKTYLVRIPKGVIPEAAIAKLNALKLLEALQPLIELQAIDEKMFFYIRFPAGKDINEAYDEARNYEKLLKSIISSTDGTSIESVLEKVSNIKVVPLFGNQETVNSQTVKQINRIELNQLDDLRKSISNLVGVDITNDPEFHITTKYLLMIKNIREKIAFSIKAFLVDFIDKNYQFSVTFDDISVQLPEIQGADDIDTIEYMTLLNSAYNDIQGMITSTEGFIQSISQSEFIDKNAVLDYYSVKLNKIVGAKVMYDSKVIDLNSRAKEADKDSTEVDELHV